MDEQELKEKANAILKLKTMHDRELWSMRLCAEILGTFLKPWWNWEDIGVRKLIKAECCECGKEVYVPEDIVEDDIAIFCSQSCIDAEAKAAYNQEMMEQAEENKEDES